MCGIAGWYRRSGGPVSSTVVQNQCQSLFHRGPDDDGIFVDGDFGFGMRRLSILDIAGGHQPMETADKRFVIVFNGEIYNHRDIRDTLAGRYPFVTGSDTETILAAFSVWGNDAWAMLEGMFAVAIWDRLTRTLTLSRDALGIKPLYLSLQHGGIAFGSELKALRRLPGHDFTIDDRAVHDFFSFGHVRRPRSIFREVFSLDPGHYLTIGAEGEPVVRAYWKPRLRQASTACSAEEWVEQMRAMLLDSTSRHLQSDVPVGAFLSGGIDSAAILAAARRSSDQPITAFTVGYPGARIDETAAAAEIAAHLGCEHIVLPLKPDDAIAILPDLVRSFDEPFADMAAIPTWYASKLAGEHVKVVLCGEGGDEMFAGYKRHRNAHAIERWRSVIDAIGPLGAMIDRVPVTRSSRINYLRQHARRFAEFIRLPDGYQQFFAATQISSSSLRRSVFTPEFRATFEGADSLCRLEEEYFSDDNALGLSALDQFLFGDLTLNMPSAMLTRLDRMSMAHSVEARVPFLSQKVVDWSLTVPTSMKLSGATGKVILRRAIEPWLPPAVLRRPKQGFQIPHAHWMQGQFGAFAQTVWHDSGAASAGYLDPAAVDRLFDEHRRGAADNGRMLYAIATFGLWYQAHRQQMGSA
ncbi:asparagine synthase (glutamine-hydrolyzing) [Sphingomonas nostoxanthinifaciens]|uniref:asparagine synthase (glutamine-hydrolyzing) n=1 Tax=Sphingomonas nostoxanthinifaciens TaxID=2872652 RepID=UPI001CC1EEA5|nr:asparagine synthase (glutamine-hydrolyzing) [Sphingomonas nostoxanthinifaciens]UAK22844.1 asparagine synthase (glutamine-hydrolyzing) [Sphingomonas nostoxanthinifaciens]